MDDGILKANIIFLDLRANPGFHVVLPLSACNIAKFETWEGTAAVYPKQQYPNVDAPM